jgi:hypothetical protein
MAAMEAAKKAAAGLGLAAPTGVQARKKNDVELCINYSHVTDEALLWKITNADSCECHQAHGY